MINHELQIIIEVGECISVCLIHEIQKAEVISEISLCLEHLQINTFLHAVMRQKVKAGMQPPEIKPTTPGYTGF